ncbi:MAG: sugar ABC transporter permease [Clostridiales bacterium]|nr:sugar ABC transporter permease [Clostridiales bacterium]
MATKAVAGSDKKPMKKETRNTLIAYSFIAPNFIGFCVFTLVPMVFAIALAFCSWDGVNAIEFVGFQNFIDLVTDKTFLAAFKNTIVYSVAVVPLTLVCALGLAVSLNQPIKGRNFFRTVAFFPYVASLVAVAAVWNMIFSPSMGPVNMILSALGMVMYLAGLQGTNPELEEAAELDGANRWQVFWHITLPQLRPTTFLVVVTLTIASFKVYDQMYMITQGGPGNATITLVYYIYNVAFVNTPKYGYASAVAMVLFILVLIVTIIQFRGSSNDDT